MTTTRVSTNSAGLVNIVDEFDEDMRRNPSTTVIEDIRDRFPTESEYDRMLTRKMHRRSAPPRPAVTLAEMSDRLVAYFTSTIDGPFTVRDVRWLSGGASKVQVAFTLESVGPDDVSSIDSLVLRMEPPESLNSTSRLREFQLISAMRGTVAVPRTRWIDVEGIWFPEPAIIYEFVDGDTKPANADVRVSGTGTKFSPGLRNALGPQFIQALAAIHTFDWAQADLSAFDVPTAGTREGPRWQLNRARRIWEEDRDEDWPLIEVVASWLDDNLPVLDVVSVIHGDFRTGNFLFDEKSQTVTAWLDWERGHLGDRHRDLAWTTLPVFGNLSEDRRTRLVSGLVPEAEFLSEYEKVSGLSIDPVRLHYYKVFNAYQLVVSNWASARRVVRLGKSHQDIVLAWIEGVVYPFANEMITLIERGTG